jgi:hypothetical protein
LPPRDSGQTSSFWATQGLGESGDTAEADRADVIREQVFYVRVGWPGLIICMLPELVLSDGEGGGASNGVERISTTVNVCP